MRYSLVVYNNYSKRAKNIYEINLESILGSNYKLQDILTFTSNFKNDEELIKYLVNKDLLVPELYNGSKIGIGERNKENKLVIRHPYVVYEKYSKYLEPVILKYYYKKGLDNPDFFIPFADRTYYALSHYDNNATVKRQMVNLNLMSKYAEAYKHEFNSFEISKDFENKMNDFYKFYTTNKKGELNFTQYTKLLMNIIEFEEKQKIQKLTKEEAKEELSKEYDVLNDQDKNELMDDYEAEMNYFEQMEIDNIDEEKEKQEIMEMIDYYSTLLDSGMLTDEDRLAYQDKIDELEAKLGRKR